MTFFKINSIFLYTRVIRDKQNKNINMHISDKTMIQSLLYWLNKIFTILQMIRHNYLSGREKIFEKIKLKKPECNHV